MSSNGMRTNGHFVISSPMIMRLKRGFLNDLLLMAKIQRHRRQLPLAALLLHTVPIRACSYSDSLYGVFYSIEDPPRQFAGVVDSSILSPCS